MEPSWLVRLVVVALVGYGVYSFIESATTDRDGTSERLRARFGLPEPTGRDRLVMIGAASIGGGILIAAVLFGS